MTRILLIEDKTEVRENVSEILELSNYEVTTAENGRIGVEYARQHPPDIIVCDIMMPELDGYGVLHSLSKNPKTAAIPFIFMTAKAEKADIRRGMTLGADDYLTKPFTDLELLEAVETRLKKNDIVKKEFSNNGQGFEDFVREVKNIDKLIKSVGTGTKRTYKKKERLFAERQNPHYLYLIEAGQVKTYRSNEEGKDYITGIHSAGNYVGYLPLFEEKPYSESAEALTETQAYLIPKEDFLKLAYSNRQIAMKFFKMLSNSLADVEQRLLDMAYNSVRKRIAQTLLFLKDRIGTVNMASQPTFNILREDMASIAGTAPESAIRALSDFKSEGLIDMQGGSIVLLNVAKLEQLRN